MRSSDALTVLAELGSEQHGLVTTARAGEFGVTPVDLKRLTDHGYVTRLRRGVYALPSATDGPLQELRAAWLGAGGQAAPGASPPDTVVSHLSAAAVHGMGEVLPRHHEFTSPRRRQTTHDDVRFHRADLTRGEVREVDGLPVTTLNRTLLDLAPGTDLDHFATMLYDAYTTTGSLLAVEAKTLDACARHFGMTDGGELLDACFDRTGTPPAFDAAREALMKVGRQASMGLQLRQRLTEKRQ